jgi:hypothetical protein
MKQLIYAMLSAVLVLTASPAFTQGTAADANMQILRDKLKGDKKLVIAANMDLTDAEAAKFWPIYDSYQKDLQTINARLGTAIAHYADVYGSNTLTDEEAKKLITEVVAIDDAEAKLRRDYAAKLLAALPAKKAARYLQIESKIRAAVRYEIAANVPLVQ